MNDQKRYPLFYDDEEVKYVSVCPVCDANLNKVKANIIKNQLGLNLAHIQCDKCQNYIIALIVKTHQGVSSLGIITDLTSADANYFINKKRLKSDQIIKIHQLFNNKEITKILINN